MKAPNRYLELARKGLDNVMARPFNVESRQTKRTAARSDRDFHRDRDRDRESGLILIVVLLAVVTLSLLVSAFNASLRNSAHIARNELAVANAEGLLEAGIAISAERIMSSDPGRRWEPNGEPHSVDFAGHPLVISIADANARIDLNLADQVLIEGILAQVADNPRQVRLAMRDILERRKPGSLTVNRPAIRNLQQSAEKSDLKASGNSNPIGARKANTKTAAKSAASQTGSRPTAASIGLDPDATSLFSERTKVGNDPQAENEQQTGNFMATAELYSLDNVSPSLARRLQPFVTVHARNGRINVLTTSEIVLRALPGVTKEDARRMVKLRNEGAAGRRILLAMLTNFENLVELASGPAYLVTVSLSSDPTLRGFTAQATIGPSLDKKAPYRVLSWQDWSLNQQDERTDRQSQNQRAGSKAK